MAELFSSSTAARPAVSHPRQILLLQSGDKGAHGGINYLEAEAAGLDGKGSGEACFAFM